MSVAPGSGALTNLASLSQCGPVVAGACYIPLDVEIDGIGDSKELKEAEREAVYKALTTHPRVRWCARSLSSFPRLSVYGTLAPPPAPAPASPVARSGR